MFNFGVKFRGVRGSYPVSGKNFLEYGGASACIEVNVSGHKIIIDAGTGIIPLGRQIFEENTASSLSAQERPLVNITILLSHIHQDHIQGLNFFKPMNMINANMHIFGFSGLDEPLKNTISELVYGKSFPVSLNDCCADYSIEDISESSVIVLTKDNPNPVLKRVSAAGGVQPGKNETVISFMKSNSHPNFGVMCIKIACGKKSIVYASDIECCAGGSKKLELFAKDADLLIHDAQYTMEDYLSIVSPKQEYGHSTFNAAVKTAEAANVKKLACFHFDPSYNDEKLSRIDLEMQKKNKNHFLAKEGMEILI